MSLPGSANAERLRRQVNRPARLSDQILRKVLILTSLRISLLQGTTLKSSRSCRSLILARLIWFILTHLTIQARTLFIRINSRWVRKNWQMKWTCEMRTVCNGWAWPRMKNPPPAITPTGSIWCTRVWSSPATFSKTVVLSLSPSTTTNKPTWKLSVMRYLGRRI